MKHTVTTLAQHVMSEAGIHSVDIADLLTEVRRVSTHKLIDRELELQNELILIRTTKSKLEKL